MGALIILTAKARNELVASMGGPLKIDGLRIGGHDEGTVVYSLRESKENSDLLIMMRIICGSGVQIITYEDDYQLERYIQELDKCGMGIVGKIRGSRFIYNSPRSTRIIRFADYYQLTT